MLSSFDDAADAAVHAMTAVHCQTGDAASCLD